MQHAHIKSVGPKRPGKDKKENHGTGLEIISAKAGSLCQGVYHHTEKAQLRLAEGGQGAIDEWF